MTTFVERLHAAANQNSSLLCIGLDPDPALMPIPDVFEFNKAIIDATRDLVCAYKPNMAFYDGLGESGHAALLCTLEYLRTQCPDIPIIGDSKRGDVQSTSKFHAQAMFDQWGFDAATINPYAGHDAVQPFLDYQDKGVFVWCRSSNPGARDFQDLMVTHPESGQSYPLYELVAMRAAEWNEWGNVGLVVGAPYPEELKRVREKSPDMPILIPGVGAQRGPLELAVSNGVDPKGRNAIVNASRSVIYAQSQRKTFDEAARDVALSMRDLINWHLNFLGHPWSEAARGVTSARAEAHR